MKEILMPGEDWQLVGEGYRFTEGPAVNAKGEVFFNDVGASKTYKVGLDGKPVVWLEDSKRGDGQRFGPDGWLYANAGGREQGPRVGRRRQGDVIADGFKGNDLVVRHDGGIYVTDPFTTPGNEQGLVHLAEGREEGRGHRAEVRQRHHALAGPDAAVRGRQPHALGVQLPDSAGRVAGEQAEVLPPARAGHGRGQRRRRAARDRDGRLWVATRMGIQVCDQAGPRELHHPDAQRQGVEPDASAARTSTCSTPPAATRCYKRKVKGEGARTTPCRRSNPPPPGCEIANGTLSPLLPRAAPHAFGNATRNVVPLPDLAGHPHRAVHRLGQVLDDRQPQPGAAHLAAAGLVHPVEPLEDPRQVRAPGCRSPVSSTSKQTCSAGAVPADRDPPAVAACT